jgi:SH3-like domain-containing protein
MAGTAVFTAIGPGLMPRLLLGLALGLLPGAAAAQSDAAAIEAAVESAMAPLPAPAGPEVKAPPRDPSKGAATQLPVPRFVSLKSSAGNARRGPGLTHRIDWVFTRAGMPLRITAEYEHWRRVEDSEGLGGWVNYSLLSGVRSVLVTQDMTEFRRSPEDAAEVVYQAELGVIGRLLECEPDWCRISVEGEKGWARKTALWGVDPAEVVQ